MICQMPQELDGVKEVTSEELFKDDGNKYTYIKFSCFDDQVFLVLNLLKHIGIRQYVMSRGTQANSGLIGHSQPIITFKVPRIEKKNEDDVVLGSLTLSLGVFGQNMLIDF